MTHKSHVRGSRDILLFASRPSRHHASQLVLSLTTKADRVRQLDIRALCSSMLAFLGDYYLLREFRGGCAVPFKFVHICFSKEAFL